MSSFTFDNFGTSVWMDETHATCDLFRWLCGCVTKPEIRIISKMDYGYRTSEYHDALTTIILNQRVHGDMEMMPGEVLSLAGHAARDPKASRLGQYGPAFCSTAMLLACVHTNEKLDHQYRFGEELYLAHILMSLKNVNETHDLIEDLLQWIVREGISKRSRVVYFDAVVYARFAFLLLQTNKQEISADIVEQAAKEITYFESQYHQDLGRQPKAKDRPVIDLDGYSTVSELWHMMSVDALNTLRKNNINAPSAIDLLSKIVAQ